MRVSLRGRRAALISLCPLLAAGLQGCATLESGFDNQYAYSQDIAREGEPPMQVADRVVLSRQADGVGVILTDTAQQKQVVLDTSASVSDISMSTLEAPSRVVIDLPRVQVAGSRQVQTPELGTVKGVRLGKHADKSRVVLDIAEGQTVAPRAELIDGRIVVTLAHGVTSLDKPISEVREEKLALVNETPADQAASAASEMLAATTSTAQLEPTESAALVDREGMPLEADSAPPSSEHVAMLNDSDASGSAASEMKQSDTQVALVLPETEPVSAVEESVAAAPVAVEHALTLDVPGVDREARAIPSATVSDEVPPLMLPTEGEQPLQDNSGGEELPVINAAPPRVEPPVADKKSPSRPEPVLERTSEQVEAKVPPVPSSEVANVEISNPMGSQPSVTVQLSKPTEYFITRTAPSEYVLTIKNASTSPLQTGAPLFAASESRGIRSVRTAANGKDTLVRIFAQPETYLTARASGDAIIVEETRDMAQVSTDLRAQPKSPSAAPKTEPKGEVKGESKAESAKAEETAKSEKKAPPAPAKEKEEEAKIAPSESDLAALLEETSKYSGRLITLDLQDTDIDNALRIIAEVSNLNIVASDEVSGKITLRLVDVPWDQALDVILKSNGLDKVLEGNVMRIAPIDKLRQERESLREARAAEDDLEPLTVRYLRVSYAKAAEIKPLVETVLSDRGSVAYDERSNQLIIKDIKRGAKNVLELIKKVDLRTPQVLIETQIVEASRNLSRELGSELGFQYIQSPATGNGTGLNFPSAVAIGGSAAGGITGSSFPAAISSSAGSAVSMLFDSADGTKSLTLRLSQLEQEGRIKIISRPAVATTNNKPAEIKSVEKVRIRMPNGGFSVATGAGAQAQGTGGAAAQTIEAGIILKVTPQASPDYFVLLDIRAKSSTFSSKTTDGIPNEIERAASSTVLVSSGQTFALGGIYKITDRDTLVGMPFLKDIPFLGTFFRNSKIENSDEELLFFLTPRVVEGSFDDASMKAVS